MNRIIVYVGIIILTTLLVISIIVYINRSPAQTGSTATTTGFQPLDQGTISPSNVPNHGQAVTIPYAPTSTPTQAPIQQPPIITIQPTNFSEPFIQSAQPSPALVQQIAYQENPPEIIPPVTESQPTPQEPIETSSSSNFTQYVPYSGTTYSPYLGQSYFPSSTIPVATRGGGGSSGGGGSTESGLIAALTGCVVGLVGGPYGCIIGALLGGLSGGGILGGSAGAIIGGLIGLASGNPMGLLGGLLGGGEQLVDIQDVRGQTISVLYEPGQSQLKDNHNISIGATVLGTYGGTTGSGNFGGKITNLTQCSCGTAAGQCMIQGSESCTIQGFSRGTISLIGTN